MIVQCEQRSRAWFESRTGRVTASEISSVMSFSWKGSKQRGDKRLVESASRANYRASLVAEILTGEPDMDGFDTSAMKWGQANEDLARNAYELRHGLLVDLVGFGIHDRINRLGASPDALVGDLGGLEIKCLKSKNHLEILKTEQVPEEFLAQMYTNMAVFERDWWDFGSFDPRFPQQELQWWDKRVYRDEQKIEAIESGVLQFLDEADMEIAWLKDKYGPFDIGKRQFTLAPEGDMGITQDDIDWIEAEMQANRGEA